MMNDYSRNASRERTNISTVLIEFKSKI